MLSFSGLGSFFLCLFRSSEEVISISTFITCNISPNRIAISSSEVQRSLSPHDPMIQFQKLHFLLILWLLFSTSESIRFDLQSGHTKCIAEDIKSKSMTVGKYNVINPNEGHPVPDSHKLTVRVFLSSVLGVRGLGFLDFMLMFVITWRIFCFCCVL